jgi:hypothetical protein
VIATNTPGRDDAEKREAERSEKETSGIKCRKISINKEIVHYVDKIKEIISKTKFESVFFAT